MGPCSETAGLDCWKRVPSWKASNRLETPKRKGMTETSKSGKRPAGAAESAESERFGLALVAGGILFVLAVAVLLLRIQRIDELPIGLHHDEGAHGMDALRVLQGEHAVFFPANNGREGLIVYTIALAVSLLGRTMLALRLPTALASAGTVFIVFWLGQLLFGREGGRTTPWRGLLVGGIGAGLLAMSLGQTIIGRAALRANFLPLLLGLCLFFLWRGWEGRSWWRVALAGACAGLLPYTYLAARFAPFLFLFFGLSFLLPWAKGKTLLRAALPWAGIFLGVAGLVAAPILIHFALHPEHFVIRSNQLLILQPDRSQGEPLLALLGNVWAHLLAFGFRGDPNWRHSFAAQPMLNSWETFFFWLGAGMAVRRWQRPAYRLLLIWLAVLLLPAALARDVLVPNTLRMIGAAPAVYLLTAVGAWEAYSFLRERFFGDSKGIAAIALAFVVSGAVLAQGVRTYRTYFEEWAYRSEVYHEYAVGWVDLIQLLSLQPPDGESVYLIPDGQRHKALDEGFRSPTFEYLYQGAAQVLLFHTAMPDLAQKIESTLAAMKSISTVKVVDWDSRAAWTGDESDRFAVLFGKYGRYLGSDAYGSFRIHNYTDIALDQPWAFYDHLEPLAVYFDGGIALEGIALGQGVEQWSSQQHLDLGRDRTLWMALQWRTESGLDVDYAISLRLYNTEGERSYQRDIVLWKPDHTLTGSGGASELFDTMVQFGFPTDLARGEYELRLVVYSTETQIPTVEIGVWEPELLLARLRLGEGP